MKYQVNEQGYYGNFGGAFIPEMLHRNVEELRNRYLPVMTSKAFIEEFRKLLQTFAGRPTPLFRANRLSEKHETRIYLKREDLCHTGAHKINNTLGQILLARHLGKRKIIAETGAGQHGVATATVCALMNMDCIIFMGQTDMERQRLNVERMRLLGARVVSVHSGGKTLKDATNEALRHWINHPDAHYAIGSVVGPHPYPDMVTRFQSVISEELRSQVLEVEGSQPGYVVACVGGGSNAAGAFYNFLDDTKVKLIGVEAAGKGNDTGYSAATTVLGSMGILHGSQTLLLQTDDGQVTEAHSISAGLDYPGIGPQHAHLHQTGRVQYLSVTDDEALRAGIDLARMEGIIPAIESAHALAALNKMKFRPDDVVVVNLSGRGDKDLETYMNAGLY